MTREIKFRAWDKVEHLMVFVDEINWRSDFLAGFYEKGGTSGVVKDYELMQFTGLHDKNGKEIYEGDILRVVALEMQVIWDKEKANYKLVESFKANITRNPYMEKLSASNAKKYKIIGNIYETPELLTNN